MGQQIMLMAITYFVAEIVILCHLKCPPDVTPRGNVQRADRTDMTPTCRWASTFPTPGRFLGNTFLQNRERSRGRFSLNAYTHKFRSDIPSLAPIDVRF